MDEATERLRVIEAELEKKAEENRARERCLIMHGVSKTGERIRRAQGAFNRLLIQNVNTVQKVQREDDRGWEALRKLREEKRALRRNKNKRDMRMVMDADGKVHDAEGYAGDVEAGVERFERKFGSQTNERTIERNMLNAVPDYARWKPPGDEQQEIRSAGRGRRNGQDGEPKLDWAYEESARRDEMERREHAVAAEAEANAARRFAAEAESKLRNEAETSAAIPTDAVTLIVTGTVIQENVRNEIDDAATTSVCEAGLGVEVDEQSAETGALEVNRTSVEVREPIAGAGMALTPDGEAEGLEDGATGLVSVILTEPVERENIRNEIEERLMAVDGPGSQTPATVGPGSQTPATVSPWLQTPATVLLDAN